MENRDHALFMAESLAVLAKKKKIPFIFKISFDKANRTSLKGYRGVGLDDALSIFDAIKTNIGCPILTDVHTPEQCKLIAPHIDVLQIPAFLCRQTDLLQAAAETGKIVNIKKGQFLAPWDTFNIVDKMEEFGNTTFMLCERGISFGYNTLVVDMRSLPIMASTGYPIVFDATHSVQNPGGAGQSSGGKRIFAPILARSALAVGVAAIFAETHQDPDHAPSDGPNMIHLHEMDKILDEWKAFDDISKNSPRNLPFRTF